MDSSSFYPKGLKPVTLQNDTGKFFEVRVDENNCKVYFAEGRIEDGKPVQASIDRFDQQEDSLGATMNLVNQLINAKLDTGFNFADLNEQDEVLERDDFHFEIMGGTTDAIKQQIYQDVSAGAIKYENTELNNNTDEKNRAHLEEIKLEEDLDVINRQQIKRTSVNSKPSYAEEEKIQGAHEVFSNQQILSEPSGQHQQLISMSEELWDYIDQIDKNAQELQVSYEPTMNSVLVSSLNPTSLYAFAYFLQGLQVAHDVLKKEMRSRYAENQDSKKNTEEIFIQKELKLCSSVRIEQMEIEKMAITLGLIYENLDDKVLVAGPQKAVSEFIAWIYDFTAVILEQEIQKLKDSQQSDLSNGDYCQDKIYPSTFHRANKDIILNMAIKLDVVCDFGYDLILASATKKNLNEFKSYLHEVEATAKKALYPKYWDFDEINTFSETEILASDPEFFEVSTLFYASLNNSKIEKLTRIQNKYLMDHYVTMLQKRQELRPNTNINRKLLFHGTRNIEPHKIYKSSDTGFDLQYSNPNGSYGKGLYFAISSNYSHNGYTYNMGNGRYQMFLADVFVGNAYRSGPNKFVKAPEGFDSVEGKDHGFHILYNNFHSYPLYLIEYTMNGNGNMNNNIGLMLPPSINPYPNPNNAGIAFNNIWRPKSGFNAHGAGNNSGGLFKSLNLQSNNNKSNNNALFKDPVPFPNGLFNNKNQQ